MSSETNNNIQLVVGIIQYRSRGIQLSSADRIDVKTTRTAVK
jgi:hypothetical protein